MEGDLKAKISIQQILWNGWAIKTGEPSSQTKPPETIEVNKGQKITLTYSGTSYNVQVTDLKPGLLTLQAENLLVKNLSTGDSLQPRPIEVTFKQGTNITLYTPTLDAGAKWVLTYLEDQTTPQLKPAVKILLPKMNWQPVQELIGKLEQRLSTRVICYYVSLFSKMQSEQADLFFEHLKKVGYQESLTLFLFGPGGDPTSALRIATILKEYCKNLQILVPSCCASAATLLTLSADKIIMSAAGYLTAIDASLVTALNPRGFNGLPVSVSIEQIKRITSFLNQEGPVQSQDKIFVGTYRTLFRYIHPLVVAEISRNSSLSELVATKIMKMHPQSFAGEEKIAEIAKKLINDYPTHSFPILYQEAKDMGLPVEKADRELSELMWELVKLYELATQIRTTNFSPVFFHYEEFPIMIETTGYRTAYRLTYNKRFNPILKRGDKENDFSGWCSITQSPGKPGYKISSLDVPSQANKPNPPEDISKNPAPPPPPTLKKQFIPEEESQGEF